MKAFRTTTLFSLFLAAMALFLAAPTAFASSIAVYGTPAENDNTSISATTNINVVQFYSAPGIVAGDTLTSVEVILSGAGSTVFTAELINDGFGLPGGTGSFDTLTTDATLKLTSAAISNLNLALSGTETFITPITLTVTGPAGEYHSVSTPIIQTAAVNEFPSISGFDATGTVGFTLKGSSSSTSDATADNDYGVLVTGSTKAGGTVEVIYNYTPGPGPIVPEPGTLGMLGSGLLGLAGMLRSKFKQAR